MNAIAIDGPAGAGKSTVAARVAGALGLAHVDTGAMYRAVALAALGRGCDPADARALGRLAAALEMGPAGRIRIDGEALAGDLRAPEVSRIAAVVSAHPEVRRALVELQRALATRSAVVMEGRDIGTEVLPDAALKIFLTASSRIRAQRRLQEQGSPDRAGELDRIEAQIRARDEADTERPHSPLRRAPDALEIDTTSLTIDEVVARIVEAARARGIS